jgi:REP element-mobilizing transposase RayT
MRTARIKISAAEAAAMYHCISRTVNGEWLLEEADKEEVRRLVWVIAEACGVEVITYAILSNHLHVIVLVPLTGPVSDEELLRRFRLRRPKPNKYDVAQLEVIAGQLAANSPEGAAWRRRQVELMGDVSQYMKLLKQKITTSYNRTHRRFGTLWSERFTSVLVEGKDHLAQIMATYVDLNPVRANIVDDPKDYRFCGYAEAVAGSPAAQRGIMRVTGISPWNEAHAAYRQTLFGMATAGRDRGRVLPFEELQRVVREGGHLPLSTVLRCRLRYLTGSAVLGSKAFVAAHLEEFRRRYGLRRRTEPPAVPAVTEWGALSMLRSFRRDVFG